MREFLVTVAIAVAMLLAAMYGVQTIAIQIGFTATEVEVEGEGK